MFLYMAKTKKLHADSHNVGSIKMSTGWPNLVETSMGNDGLNTGIMGLKPQLTINICTHFSITTSCHTCH